MNTFWLKLAAVGVIALLAMVGFSMFWSGDGSSPRSNSGSDSTLTDVFIGEQKGLSEVIREDSERLHAAPQVVEQPEPVAQEQQPSESENAEQTVANSQPEATAATENQEQEVEIVEIQFKPMSEEDQIEAERLLEVAIRHVSMARMGPIGLKTTVECCRQIIEKWPGTEYEFKAKRVLNKVPERHRATYNITPEELDLGNLK